MKHFKAVYEEYILEGVYDPGIFKAFFLAGGPGSGKTFVTQSAFAGTGLKVVNSDTAFERGLRQANLSLAMPPEEEYFRDLIRQRAKTTTANALDIYMRGRLGIIIDATGRDYGLVNAQVNSLKAIGYDCYMIFVNTNLDVALERNRKRERTLPDYIIKNNWDKIQRNIGGFQKIFKPQNFLIIDNNKSEQELVTNVLNQAARFVKNNLRTPPNNLIAKNWIARELEIRKRT